MSWVLVCDTCAHGREIKTIGVMRPAPVPCAVCGVVLPAMQNGLSGGNPVRPEEVEEMRRLRPGTDHCNCQPPEYWLEKFAARGWVPSSGPTDILRAAMVRLNTAHCEYATNFYVLVPR